MKVEELKEELAVELDLMDGVVKELLSLSKDVINREPTIREKTAAAGRSTIEDVFLQFESSLSRYVKSLESE